jgi:hypothetical protein
VRGDGGRGRAPGRGGARVAQTVVAHLFRLRVRLSLRLRLSFRSRFRIRFRFRLRVRVRSLAASGLTFACGLRFRVWRFGPNGLRFRVGGSGPKGLGFGGSALKG